MPKNNAAAEVWAIVPATGVGRRMQNETPKQYLKFAGKTILEHSLDRVLSYPDIEGVILVLSANDQFWQGLNYRSQKAIFIVEGGVERHHSVYNGLSKLLEFCSGNCLALVHDAVRPLVTHQELASVIAAGRDHEAGALLASPVTDTLKRQDQSGNSLQTIARDNLWRAFTPQLFRAELLHKALRHALELKLPLTDDAAAIEALGLHPRLVAGSSENIKITLPEDLALAEQIWLRQQESAQ